MKFKLYGKILERSSRRCTKKDGSSYDLYSLVIEEPGKYPQIFKCSSKDASLFGQKDGLFGVGKYATVEGFVNGGVRDVVGKDGRPFKSYNVYLTISSLESAPSASDPAPIGSEEVADDIPF